MSHSDIATKAKLVLARRDVTSGVWFYVSYKWKRQLLFLLAYVAIPTALWNIDATTLAIAVACFFAGAKIRDVRWWFTLSKEWPTTSALLDWPKIEAIANGTAANGHRSPGEAGR